jgi:hypothetical protein
MSLGEMPAARSACLDLAQLAAQRVHFAGDAFGDVALQVLAQVDERLGDFGHRIFGARWAATGAAGCGIAARAAGIGRSDAGAGAGADCR